MAEDLGSYGGKRIMTVEWWTFRTFIVEPRYFGETPTWSWPEPDLLRFGDRR